MCIYIYIQCNMYIYIQCIYIYHPLTSAEVHLSTPQQNEPRKGPRSRGFRGHGPHGPGGHGHPGKNQAD